MSTISTRCCLHTTERLPIWRPSSRPRLMFAVMINVIHHFSQSIAAIESKVGEIVAENETLNAALDAKHSDDDVCICLIIMA